METCLHICSSAQTEVKRETTTAIVSFFFFSPLFPTLPLHLPSVNPSPTRAPWTADNCMYTYMSCACVHAKSLQSYLTLCDPMNYSPPGSSVHGILQARRLEWVAMPSSRGSFQPRDWTHVSCSSWIAGRFFTTEPLGKPTYLPHRHLIAMTIANIYS